MSSRAMSWSGLSAMIGGVLWAVTPLRDVTFGGGGTPGHVVFRPYNVAQVLIAALLIIGVVGLHARYTALYGRLGKAGTLVTAAGHILSLVGSLPAVLLSEDRFEGLIQTGQDLGFLGALVAALGGIFLGIALRRTPTASKAGALLLILTLPVGLLGIIVISAMGAPSVAGLAMTVPYGVAWLIFGNQLWSTSDRSTGPVPSVGQRRKTRLTDH